MQETDTILTVASRREGAEVRIYKRGSGDLLATAQLTPVGCVTVASSLLDGATLIEKHREEFGHWVHGHGYHAP